MRAFGGLRADRHGGAGTAAVLLIIIVVVALIFVVPSLSGGSGNVFADVQKRITDFLNGLFGGLGGGGNTGGFTAVSFRANYEDGTNEWFNASGGFSLFPLTITVNNKPLQSLDIYTVAQLKGNSTISSWSSATKMQIEIYHKPETTPELSSTADYSQGGSSWASGITYSLAHTNILGSTLDSLVAQYGNGGWLLQVQGTVQLSATVNGIPQSFNASAPSGGVDFAYSRGTGGSMSIMQSFSVTTGTTPLTK